MAEVLSVRLVDVIPLMVIHDPSLKSAPGADPPFRFQLKNDPELKIKLLVPVLTMGNAAVLLEATSTVPCRNTSETQLLVDNVEGAMVHCEFPCPMISRASKPIVAVLDTPFP